jgi:hypothetical protein
VQDLELLQNGKILVEPMVVLSIIFGKKVQRLEA